MGWIRVSRNGGANFHEIPADGLVVGRSAGVEMSLHDRSVSRMHARVRPYGGQDQVEDLGSTNGTFVNERRVTDAVRLNEGDHVRFGEISAVYFRDPPSSDELERARLKSSSPPDTSSPGSSVEAQPAAEPVASGDLRSEKRPRSDSDPSPRPGRVPTIADSEPASPTEWTAGRPLRSNHRWQQLSLIGKGGMGEVYRAFDRDLAEKVAIKRLRDRGDGSRDLLARLHAREASIARTIRHPNVVQVLEDGVIDGAPFMLLEWVEGLTFDRYRDHPETLPEQLIECVRQIALGLTAAHEAGVVHADLKPANVLVQYRRDDEERVANLGILEAPDGETESFLERRELDEEIARRIGLEPMPDFDEVPCVGRAAELAFLEQIAVELVESGEALRWVLIFGERGVGKRCLCQEFQSLSKASGRPIPLTVAEDGQPPPVGASGLWISLYPPYLPDDADLRRDYEAAKLQDTVRELFVKPFLKGQSIRLVERLVKHRESARAFVDRVQDEVGGNPARLLERLQRSFTDEAWQPVGTSYRLDPDAISPDSAIVIRRRLEQYEAEEKGLRDVLVACAPLGNSLDYSVIRSVVSIDQASLYYLFEHAVRSGFLKRVGPSRFEWVHPQFRRVLADRLDPKARAGLVRKALPSLRTTLEDGVGAPAALWLETARLERSVGANDRAFRNLLGAALAARSEYDHEIFFEAIDTARELYRHEDKRRVRKAMGLALESEFDIGGGGIAGGGGVSALDRLRRLPTRVLARLTDFGIAQRVVEGRSTPNDESQPWGTPRYMSPEQARREPLSPASDIFSLGVILREALEGEHPLGTRRGTDAMRELLARSEPTPMSDSVPEGLREVILNMLDYNPRKRPSAAEVAARIQRHQIRFLGH